jgi:hypothetical protein
MANLFLNTRVYCYNRVRRWSSRDDVFSYSKVFFPINLDNTHWTFVVWIVESSTLIYNDSMHGNGRVFLDVIRRWIFDEAADKGITVHLRYDSFVLVDTNYSMPEQANGKDCGMFVLMGIDFMSDSLELSFSTPDMLYFRKKIVCDIKRGRLDYELPVIHDLEDELMVLDVPGSDDDGSIDLVGIVVVDTNSSAELPVNDDGDNESFIMKVVGSDNDGSFDLSGTVVVKSNSVAEFVLPAMVVDVVDVDTVVSNSVSVANYVLPSITDLLSSLPLPYYPSSVSTL